MSMPVCQFKPHRVDSVFFWVCVRTLLKYKLINRFLKHKEPQNISCSQSKLLPSSQKMSHVRTSHSGSVSLARTTGSINNDEGFQVTIVSGDARWWSLKWLLISFRRERWDRSRPIKLWRFDQVLDNASTRWTTLCSSTHLRRSKKMLTYVIGIRHKHWVLQNLSETLNQCLRYIESSPGTYVCTHTGLGAFCLAVDSQMLDLGNVLFLSCLIKIGSLLKEHRMQLFKYRRDWLWHLRWMLCASWRCISRQIVVINVI